MSERENSEKNLHKAIVILGKIPELPLLPVEDTYLVKFLYESQSLDIQLVLVRADMEPYLQVRALSWPGDSSIQGLQTCRTKLQSLVHQLFTEELYFRRLGGDERQRRHDRPDEEVHMLRSRFCPN
ncbi:hypothetical protein LTR72_010362 [Exophiala xenobiotica]|nr:hypothetical protein LTR92_009868 [Exophiala xenobiotica]KAK5205557.1 hypothetical protein LTR41_008625 [Exophiala xenobiotica]KAK5216694.1 hypothetical protein LTR72_010362 [Exophiala xenobiotica]KAK5286233.1 hypothetical protein LTR14_010192 [Exophiala xenobiotica]KAK5331048.1 hypothetical protein LTR93_000049 [Exophiala xenobiotica]